jgi:hypothetical protein
MPEGRGLGFTHSTTKYFRDISCNFQLITSDSSSYRNLSNFLAIVRVFGLHIARYGETRSQLEPMRTKMNGRGRDGKVIET